MPDYDNKNTGILFFNEDKKSEKAPDLSGFWTDENGYEMKIKGYYRQSNKTGKRFISISQDTFEPQTDRPTGKDSDSWKAAREKFKKDDVTDTQEINIDDIPF